MKKQTNFLMLLLAMLIGVFTAHADEVPITIDVDNAANVTVAYQSPYGDALDLKDGVNNLNLETGFAIFVSAKPGAEIISVTCNDEPKSAGYNGQYSIGVVANMEVKIVTSGAGSNKVGVMFTINADNTASVTSGGETTKITNFATIMLDADDYAVITPEEGYSIDTCTPIMTQDFTFNSDGSFSFKPVANEFITLNTKKEGLEFYVNINVPANVAIGAWAENNDELGGVTLEGWTNPYKAIAPKNTHSITFWPVEGGMINSIKKVSAQGVEEDVVSSAYAGYRTTVAAGDTFIVDALGDYADVKFYGYDDKYADLDLSAFVIKVGNEVLDLSGAIATGKARVGELLTVSGARGYELKGDNALSGSNVKNVTVSGPSQSVLITGKNVDVFMYAKKMTGMVINVDNAAAVTLTQANGNGDVLTITDGENTIASVVNPIKITANEKYQIESAVLDGINLESADGSYVAELLEGSTLSITTSKIPEAMPINITTIGGEVANLIIKVDGKVVEFNPEEVITAKPGSEITISAALGYMLESVSDFSGNPVTYDDWDDFYTIALTKNTCMISVIFKQPSEGKVMVGFSRDVYNVSAYLFDKDGVRNSDPKPASLKAGRTIEVEIGDQVQIEVWGDYMFDTVTINGTKLELAQDALITEMISITEPTVIEVTTRQKEHLVRVWGYDNLEPLTGYVMGEIFINEIGQTEAMLRPGEKFYVIPVAAKGYKFTGFREIKPNLTVTDPVDGKYEFTVPDDETLEFVLFKGEFVIDEEHPAYLVEGNSLYDEGIETNRKLYGLVRIDDGTPTGTLHVTAYEGETVKLLFFQNIDEFPISDWELYSFCLFNNPDKLIPQEYTVNPEDVRDMNVISIGGIMRNKSQSEISEIVAAGRLYYDSEAQTVNSDNEVKVFTTSGQLVMKAAAGESSLERLPAGLYILTNGTDTIKIVK